MPPKIDKSHGFMKSIIKNQVCRDEYDKQQKITSQQKAENEMSSQSRVQQPTRVRTPKREGIKLYVPPHLKTMAMENNKDVEEKMETDCPSEPSKQSPTGTVEKVGQKRSRKAVPVQQDTSRVLFKFEYEDDEGNVKSFDVMEDDNAEDLGEIFGNQLGLTKMLKNALKYRLNHEITKCLNERRL